MSLFLSMNEKQEKHEEIVIQNFPLKAETKKRIMKIRMWGNEDS